MNPDNSFERLRALTSNWLSRDALPLWIGDGFDRQSGLFHERLDFSGRPIPLLPRRLMVQCRQLYVLTHATLRGIRDERALIDQTWEQIIRHYYRSDLPHRWVFSIGADGGVHDPKCDAYTLAFVLFLLAWLHRLEPRPTYLALADEIFDVLDGSLAAPAGGVVDAWPRPDAFVRQNPNMHLLEACLALYESAGRAQDLSRAEAIHRVFSTRMIWRRHRALPEQHDDDWNAEGIEAGWYEPGHHFEWAWLLRRLARFTRKTVDQDVEMLLSRALSEGIDTASMVVERVQILSGESVPTRRLWGTCEYLKACAAEAEADPLAASAWRDRAASSLRSLHRTFLAAPRQGLWVDRVDASDRPLSNDVPASSLYHLMLAIAECERVFGRVAPDIESPAHGGALFLDRDGVINVDTGYPNRPEQITFIEGAAQAISEAKAAGYRVVVVTNQSGVARGYASEADVMNLHRWMSARLKEQGATVDAWYHCPFHERGSDEAYAYTDHFDRKPNPGMLKRAACEMDIDLARSLMIGDKNSDLFAAQRAGVAGHLFEGGNLAAFVKQVLRTAKPL